MKTIDVRVQEDHLEVLARSKPMTALAELIWNALDAEATEVRVEFEQNELEGLEAIRIVDNGNGLHYEDAFIVFQNLGGSWKRSGRRTYGRKRILHGQYGKGRFRAFSLGNKVAWNSVYDEGSVLFSFVLSGHASKMGQFSLSDHRAVAPSPELAPGMTVCIEDPPDTANLLRGAKALEEVTQLFALYLRQYPDVRIVYDGVPLDAGHVEDRYTEYALPEIVTQDGERVEAWLSVVEWNMPGKRGLYLCDEEGFALHNALPRLHFRGFSHTAYLRSAHIPVLDREGLLQAGELAPDLALILDAARAKLREHFALREAENARDTIEEWIAQNLYPYAGAPADDAEANERRIFDIYATHLNQILPDFAKSTPENKRLVLRLFKELVRTQPTRIARVLDELLDFPEDKEGEILELVQS